MYKIPLIICLLAGSFVHAETTNELLQAATESIIGTGRFLNSHNLCPATSGNISVRIDDALVAITVSGKHKGELTSEDVLLVNLAGEPQDNTKRASAETLLHTAIYTVFKDAGAVVHNHTLNGTVLSRLVAPQTALITEGYEIHKAFTGITTHESSVTIPIFENTQDMTALSKEVTQYLQTHPKTFGLLVRGHGLYTWGKDMKEAKLRVEAFEYLFESELKMRSFSKSIN